MLKFDLGAAPSDFSPSPPGRKLRGTQRPATFLKNGDFPQPVVGIHAGHLSSLLHKQHFLAHLAAGHVHWCPFRADSREAISLFLKISKVSQG